MKQFLMSIAILLFVVSSSFASQRCPLEGHSFILTPPKSSISYELTDFDCSFGPGCNGSCSLWYGDFKLGPLHRIPLDFSCSIPRDASPDEASIFIYHLPCFLDANSTSLSCLPISMDDYHAIKISGKVFYVPKDVNIIKFHCE